MHGKTLWFHIVYTLFSHRLILKKYSLGVIKQAYDQFDFNYNSSEIYSNYNKYTAQECKIEIILRRHVFQ